MSRMGIYGPFIAFGLFYIQAAFPIVPYALIAGAAGMVYGKFWGFWLAYLGALSGATSLFLLVRTASRDRFVRLVMKKYNFDLKGQNPRRVFGILLVMRLFPVVPTPVINVGSAVSGVSLPVFFFSSMLGKIPWAAVYVCLGDYLIRTHNLVGTVTTILFIIMVSILGVRYFRPHLPVSRTNK